MVESAPSRDGFHVVIAGGGVAALEATLALRDLAPDRVRVTVLAPQEDFVYRPMTVREPFAYPRAHRHRLAEMASDLGAEILRDSFAWVEPDKRVAHTEGGQELTYDALLLAIGAQPQAPFSHARTVDDKRLDELLHGLIQDVEGGYVKSLAFITPTRIAWPLPIYELALMTAARAYEMDVDVDITVATPEDAPLAVFGEAASTVVGSLLTEAGIQMITSAYVEVPRSGKVIIHPGDRHLEVDSVVALPELVGPSIRGLPEDEHGFIPVTPHGQVRGVERVYAAGDATDFPIKHGGLAAQQADAAAASIAALAGANVEPKPFDPVIRGMLLTGGRPRYLSAQITGGTGSSSQITDEPPWSPPTKIAAHYLAPYLDARDRAGDAAR